MFDVKVEPYRPRVSEKFCFTLNSRLLLAVIIVYYCIVLGLYYNCNLFT